MELESETIDKCRTGSPNPCQKRVDFDLDATTVHDFYVYRRNVKRGKCTLNPFDPSKKPKHGVLKNSTPSPISPFFKRAYNIKIWTPEVSTDQLIEQVIEMETES